MSPLIKERCKKSGLGENKIRYKKSRFSLISGQLKIFLTEVVYESYLKMVLNTRIVHINIFSLKIVSNLKNMYICKRPILKWYFIYNTEYFTLRKKSL